MKGLIFLQYCVILLTVKSWLFGEWVAPLSVLCNGKDGPGTVKKEKKNIASRVASITEGKINELGYSLWDVEYLREGTDWFLRITIDSPNGIEIDDCEKVHRAIEPLIDEADPIEDAYYLEISSPGLERELRTDAHLEASIGACVELRFYAPINGQKSLLAVLSGFDRENLMLTAEDESEFSVSRASVAKISTVCDFEE